MKPFNALIGILIILATFSMAAAVYLVLDENIGSGEGFASLPMFSRTETAPVFAGNETENANDNANAPTNQTQNTYIHIHIYEEPPADGSTFVGENYIQIIPLPSEPPTEEEPTLPCPYTVTITLSAAGDTTLGGDSRWGGYHAFMREFRDSGHDHSHFMRNVAHIFRDSDLAIVNLEGTLTYATDHMDKAFVFRGPPHFARILSSAYVDAVTISNNHTIDFFDQGYRDTVDALRAEDIAYFGNEFNIIKEVNGIQVGMFGYRIWGDTAQNRNNITRSIEYLQENGAQLIIAYFHWGVEGANTPEQYQVNIGRFAIRQGIDLVLGAHPHVIQGTEKYMGRHIVYSLANFCFGGNANPRDQDSFIFQQTFTFYQDILQPNDDTNIIPVFVSSVRYRNDFQPTVAEGEDAERILARIATYSALLSH